MKNLISKYKELILYLIFGVLTTLVNIIAYAVSTRVFSLDVYSSNVIAWVFAVLFAYVTNKNYVFSSKAQTNNEKIKELLLFYWYRLLTFGVDMLIMYIMVDLMGIDDLASKIIDNVVIIALNYVFSKCFIFKK